MEKEEEGPYHPSASCASMKSDWSMKDPLDFKGQNSETTKTDYSGEERLCFGLYKYACEPTLDPSRACGNFKLSEKNTKVTALRKKKPFTLIPERFFYCCILCTDSIIGRCYWEVEWKGDVFIGVTGQTTRNEGQAEDCLFDDDSWCLQCTDYSYTYWNSKTRTSLPIYPTSNRVGVYVDYANGRISFFDKCFDKWNPVYTIHSTFTKPLFPWFGLGCQSTVHVLPIFTLPAIHDSDILPLLSFFKL